LSYGMTSFLLQIPGGWIADRYDKRKVVIVTYVIAAPFFAFFSTARNIWEPFIFMSFSRGLTSMVWSAHQSLRMNLTPSSRWGLVNALSYMTYWGGMMIGSAFSGVLWDNFGMSVPYYVSSITVLASLIPMFFLGKIKYETVRDKDKISS